MSAELVPAEKLGRHHREPPPRRRPAGELDPEWIMVGVDVPAGKRLYASKDLKGSRFQVALDEFTGSADGWYLTSTMQHMLIITKPSYGEAMAEAVRIWKNWADDGEAQPAIGPGGRRIGKPGDKIRVELPRA